MQLKTATLTALISSWLATLNSLYNLVIYLHSVVGIPDRSTPLMVYFEFAVPILFYGSLALFLQAMYSRQHAQ